MDTYGEGQLYQRSNVNNRSLAHTSQQHQSHANLNQAPGSLGTLNSPSLCDSGRTTNDHLSSDQPPSRNSNNDHGAGNLPSTASTVRGVSLSDLINAQVLEYDRHFQANHLLSQSASNPSTIPPQYQYQSAPIQTNQASDNDWVSSLSNLFGAGYDDRASEEQVRECDHLHQSHMQDRQSLIDQNSITHGNSSQPIAPSNAFEGMAGVTSNATDVASYPPSLHAQEVAGFSQLSLGQVHSDQPLDSSWRQPAANSGRYQDTIQEGDTGYTFHQQGKRYDIAIPTPTRHNTKPVTCSFCVRSLFIAVDAKDFYCQACGNLTEQD